MKRRTKRLAKRLLGTSNLFKAGWSRALRGLRTGDQTDLYMGLGIAALAFLQRTTPRKTLIYRKSIAEGSAIVIHSRGARDPKIEVTRPR